MRSDKNVHHSRRFKVSIPLREECESGTPFDPEDIVIYTDGTKMEASSGAGILFGSSPNEWNNSVGQVCINNMQTEVYAIL